MSSDKASVLAGRLFLVLTLFGTGHLATGAHEPSLTLHAEQQLWSEAESRYAAKDYPQALRCTLRLLRSYPDNALYRKHQAFLYEALGDSKREAAAWELFARATPHPGEACPNIGRAYERMGEARAAAEAYHKCLEWDPAGADTQFFGALALEREDKEEEAEKLYSAILKRYPGYFDASIAIARMRVHQGRAAQAEEIISRVLKSSPENADGLLVGALAARSLGKRDVAKARLLAAVKIAPSYADLYRILGRLYDEEGSPDQALKTYTKLSQLEPADAEARRRVESLKGDR